MNAPTLKDIKTIDVHYAGRTIALADLPEYRKFYRKLAAGDWEPQTLEVLARHLDRDTVLIDIGAWIGVTPFFGAEIAKSVVAVDPDPICVSILQRLAEGRENVTVMAGALSNCSAVSIHAVDGFGSSETSVLDIGDGECTAAPGLRLDDIMRHADRSRSFVKVDIEGYEFVIGEELARLEHFPVRGLQIAMHPQLYEKSLSGARVARRLRTALATWRLGQSLRRRFCGPALVKYPGLLTYILFGILLRVTPKGADFLFEQRLGKTGETG